MWRRRRSRLAWTPWLRASGPTRGRTPAWLRLRGRPPFWDVQARWAGRRCWPQAGNLDSRLLVQPVAFWLRRGGWSGWFGWRDDSGAWRGCTGGQRCAFGFGGALPPRSVFTFWANELLRVG